MIRRYLIAAALGALAFTGWTYWRASRTAGQAADEVRGSSESPFTLQILSDPPPAGWEPLASPADFRDAAVWNGKLYVAGANALFCYDADGALTNTWRAGLELPSAPLAALAAAEELWIATDGAGALSFDGSRFRLVLPSSAPARRVRSLLPLSTGAVLLGTAGGGVLRFDGSQLRPFHPALAGVAATALAGVEEDLWVGTRDAGVIHLRAGHAERFAEAEGLPDRSVHSLAAAGDRAFAGTSTGIAMFQDGRFQRVLGQGLLATSLTPRGGELLVATLADGWLRIPLEGRPTRLSNEDNRDGGPVRRVFPIGDDLYVLRPDSLEILRDGRSARAVTAGQALLSHGNISALAMDAAARLWVGYFDHGLDIVDTERRRITPIQDERIFCVNRIVRSEDGQQMAVATANGLVFFDAAGAQRQVLTRSEGLIASHVTDVAERPRGWVAATPAGITFIAGTTRSVSVFHGLVNNHVYTLGLDGGTLLAGTLGGVSVLDSERVKAGYTTANSALRTNWITALARVDGDWFAGTYGGGVERLDASGVWRGFDSMPPGVVVNPNAMAVSPRAVYAGTLEHGLLVWDRRQQSWRAVRAGLPSVNVTAMLYYDNRLYVGTDNGLAVVPESNIGL
jgi:ligand-binding sensor domain-containing protein